MTLVVTSLVAFLSSFDQGHFATQVVLMCLCAMRSAPFCLSSFNFEKIEKRRPQAHSTPHLLYFLQNTF
jgi:hypothetical protein